MTANARDQGMMENDAINAEAASWFVRIHVREPGTEEVADWQRWLIADDAHRQAFVRFENLWQTIGQTDVHFRTQSGNDATSSPGAVSVRRALRLRWLAAAAGLVAAVGIGYLSLRSPGSARLPESAVVETRRAEDRTYQLADGSRVDVGARTRIVVDFSDATRSVVIDAGEAYFEVAREDRPFVVRAGSGTITAAGTAFNIHHVQGRVAVAVVEGAVKVLDFADNNTSVPPVVSEAPRPGAALSALVVRAGEGVVYGREATTVGRVDTRVATAWRDGHLKFVREPLGYVTADLERYADIQVSIADPAVAELRYTGTVIPDDVEDWLAVISHAFPIEVQRISRRMVLLKLRAEPTSDSAALPDH